MSFKPLEGDLAVVRTKGVYKQGPLYTFKGGLFVKLGSGFIRLKSDGSTSHADTALEHVETDQPLFRDTFNRLSVEPAEGRVATLAIGKD